MRATWLLPLVAILLHEGAGAQQARAQTFCAELGKIVPRAERAFVDIRGAKTRGGSEVTISLPEASECWYRDHGSAYWCSWKVPLDRIDEQFIEFSRRVAACYGAARDEDHYNIDKWAYIQLPRNVEVYIVTDKGQGEINLSIEKK